MEGMKANALAHSELAQGDPVDRADSDLQAIPSRTREEPNQCIKALRLTPAQRRLWLLRQLDHSASFASQSTIGLALRGQLDRQTLRAALNALVTRQPVLRTTFPSAIGEPIQVIGPAGIGFALIEQALTADLTLEEILEHEMREPFDLSAGLLVRGRLVRVSNEEHVLLITVHHIISDRGSLGILVRDLGAIYTAFSQGRQNPLPSLDVSYSGYLDGERQRLEGEPSRVALAFWKEYLSGAPELLQLPTCRPRPSVHSNAAERVQFSVSDELTRRLREFSSQHGVTLFMTLLSGWAVLLGRWSGQDEVVIGTPAANRERAETVGLMGPFESTIAIRIRLRDNSSVAALLEHVRESTLRALAHQNTPFEEVVKDLQPTRSASQTSFIQVVLAMQDSSIHDAFKLTSLALSVLEPVRASIESELWLSLSETEGTIAGTLEYASDIFERESVERMVGQLKRLLDGLLLDDRQLIGQLSLLSVGERQKILVEFNGIERAYLGTQLVHQLFEGQVTSRSDATAVVCGTDCLSYSQLNRRANQVAHHLIHLGVRPDDRVAIFVERGLEMVIGLLGILKAGGAYLPLDLEHPADRLTYMLTDSAPVALVTQARLLDRVPRPAQPMVLLDLDDRMSPLARQPEHNPEVAGLTSSHLAYVIYTSGSTGEPKGVMNQHDAAVCRIRWAQNEYSLTHDDSVLQKTPLGCDFSVWEIFLTLSAGSKLVMAVPGGHQDPHYLVEEVERRGITTLFFVPSMLQVFVDQAYPGCCSTVRRVLSSGEALPYALQTRFLSQFPHCELHNLYGPTEGTIDVTCWRCIPDRHRGTVPMGRPIENAKIYILDAYGQPVPIGVGGEIHIGGQGVARGYLHRPELTAKRFLPDPFSQGPGARMYKTGDLGRWLPDGNIEYLGRNDFQVKIRGFRVELEEVETQLAAFEGVREAVVIVREDRAGDRRLVAYVTPKPHARLSCVRLRSYVASRLPDYMIPNAYVVLDKLPLNTNGKLDRRALPPPDESAVASRDHQPPEGEIEAVLAAIWQEMLGLERVGRQDHFFELGGHSLLGMKLIANLTERFTVQFPIFAIFQYPTIEGMAALIRRLLSETQGIGVSSKEESERGPSATFAVSADSENQTSVSHQQE